MIKMTTVISTDNDDFDLHRINVDTVMCTATPGTNPINELRAINACLKLNNIEDSIIFDLLCCNGLSSNRFIHAIIVDGAIDRSTFSVIDEIASDILEYQNTYIRSHPEYVTHSVLSSVDALRFLNGA